MKKDSKKIKCEVNACVHNDVKNSCCELSEIKICCSCCKDDVSCKDDTVCGSFENVEKKES